MVAKICNFRKKNRNYNIARTGLPYSSEKFRFFFLRFYISAIKNFQYDTFFGKLKGRIKQIKNAGLLVHTRVLGFKNKFTFKYEGKFMMLKMR